jgi:probable F420-dependent oxidoreductase
MKISGVGVWSAGLRFDSSAEAGEAAAELEELGYSSLWLPDLSGGVFDAVERLLQPTSSITVATGILSVWVYDPGETAAAHARLTEAYGGRFLLGIGVSHAPLVEHVVKDTTYEKPLGRMRTFLDGLDRAATPVPADARVLAALGPKMLALAAERSGGAHPYNVTPEHTKRARELLGPSRLLVPEQAVALTTDAASARALGRSFLETYLSLPNYANNFLRLGFGADDLAAGGSERLIDALVAWGDEATIATRVRDHLDAGADSVCVQVLSDAGWGALPRQEWRQLSPALTSL